MTQNYRQRNLRGRSFKGENLTDVDFSYSDIRGADFTDANLTNANFSHAKAGLQYHWAIVLLIISLWIAALAGFLAVLASYFVVYFFLPDILKGGVILPDLVLLGVLTIFFIAAFRQGLEASLGVAAGAGALVVAIAGTGAIEGVAAAAVAATAAVAITVSVAMAGAGAVAGIVAAVLAFAEAAAVAITITLVGSRAIAEIATSAKAVARAVVESEAITAAVYTVALALIVLSSYIGWRTLTGDKKYDLLHKIAIAFATTGGTSFRDTNLTDANFSHSTLKSTDFRRANITRTCWDKSIKLDWARVGDTILTNSAVRDLLVSKNGCQKSYTGMNLRGANLKGADLTEANLKEADISQSTLRYACLEGANLTQTQAIGTDFTYAQLTGAYGLAKWNIDNTTELKDLDCRWVYMLEHPKPRTDDRERSPSSGFFAPGEFTKLFQQVLDTIDLIFSNGLDLAAFNQSLQKVQIENEGTELEIIGTENKGDGVIIVKIRVPSDANKGKIHSQFMQFYQETLALNARQQQLLESHNQQLKDMRSVIDRIVAKPITDKLVILSFGNGDFEQGFETITAQIWSDGHFLPTTFTGKLPPKPEITELYQQWHQKYENLKLCYQAQGWYFRIRPLPNQVKQVSLRDIPKLKQEIQDLANELKKQVNIWLNSEQFSPIQNKLHSKLNLCDRIQFIIQSDDIQIRHIPWHLWNFFEEYRQAEVAFSPTAGDRLTKSVSLRNKVRILAILGNSQGINVDEDKQLIEKLPYADPVFLVEPTRKQVDESLWDEQGWDILCFSGHSSSKWDRISGCLDVNKTEKLTIEQLENALKAAIERGLHLAIFNSCDGWGLARQLDNLHIPQIIVMREFVPDLVAQEFFKNFLTAFSGGKSLHVSVREAREKLQSREDKFPCASWLPAICQNQAEAPKTWQEFIGAG